MLHCITFSMILLTAAIWAMINCWGHVFVYLFLVMRAVFPGGWLDLENKDYWISRINNVWWKICTYDKCFYVSNHDLNLSQVQFLMVFITSVSSAVSGCGYPLVSSTFTGVFVAGLYFLFWRFTDLCKSDKNKSM